MSKNSRVVWSEGLFLQPQHFQQQERFLLTELHAREQAFQPYKPGFITLVLDSELLKASLLGIDQASGFFPDGTYFSIPDKDPAPAAIPITHEGDTTEVFLTVPCPHWDSAHLRYDAGNNQSRYSAGVVETGNVFDAQSPVEPLDVAVLNCALALQASEQQGVTELRMGSLRRNTQGYWQLVHDDLPTHLCAVSQPWLHDALQAVVSTLEQKALALKHRRVRSGKHNSTELGEFLLLQTCIKHGWLLRQHLMQPRLHPAQSYMQLLALFGELVVHGPAHHMAFTPGYNHVQPSLAFKPLLQGIHDVLTGMHDQQATQIGLQAKPHGVYVGQVQDRKLLHAAQFVLAVHASAPDDLVRQIFPSTVKIGPVEQLRNLVNMNLPGVRLKPLNAAPPALPFYADYLYFQLETRNEALWKQLEASGHLALHYAGDLPDFRIELWAIRHEQEALL